jgi:hypothetical protein
MELPNYLVFDIETAPKDSAQILADAEPFDPNTVKHANYIDEGKIAAKIDKARAEHERRLIDQAALNATTGYVLAIGTYDVRENHYEIIHGQEESALLSNWWTHLYGFHEACAAQFVGFNILGFDLPFLLRRSWALGISVQSWIFDGRYFHRRFADVMQHWQLGNRQEYISLDKLARFLGLPGKSHEGKDFANLYANNQQQAIKYLKNDLKLTADIALKMGL